MPEAVKLGERIGEFSQIAAAMCKEAVNISDELPLSNVSTAVMHTVLYCINAYCTVLIHYVYCICMCS